MRPTERPVLADTCRTLRETGLSFVLLGRATDPAVRTGDGLEVDLVLPSGTRERYVSALADRRYDRVADAEMDAYEGDVVRHERTVGDTAIGVNALVGEVCCRPTGATWTYEEIIDHSHVAGLPVGTGLSASVPEVELLFTLELHGGRRGRDGLVALGLTVDFRRVERHLYRGIPDALAERIAGTLDALTASGETVADRDGATDAVRADGATARDVASLVSFLRAKLTGPPVPGGGPR